MKAIEALDCIIYMGESGEDFCTIEVPTEKDEWCPQTEEWWVNAVGGCPPAPIESGVYLIYYPNDAYDWLQTDHDNYMPDEVIDIEDSKIYLYKMEE